MAWAITQQIVTDAPARHVLLCLANYAGECGRGAFPSAATLAKNTGLSLRTVRLKLAYLEEMGVIAQGAQAVAAAYIDRPDRRPVVYDIIWQRGAAATPRENTGCSTQPNGVQLAHERGAAAAPNPSTKPPLIQKKRAPAAPLPPLPDWIDSKAWADFVENRKAIRAPMTTRAAELVILTLEKLKAEGQDVKLVLEQSTRNCWRDVFAVKPQGGGFASDRKWQSPAESLSGRQPDAADVLKQHRPDPKKMPTPLERQAHLDALARALKGEPA